MLLIDIHAHLDHPQFKDDLDKVIDNAKKAGVKSIISNGVSRISNRRVLEIAEKYDIVKAALGMYPLEALQEEVRREKDRYPLGETEYDTDEELEFIEKNKNKIIALGEVGLDYKMTKQFMPQNELFAKIIRLAEKIKKPMIVHSRKAEEAVIDMLKSSSLKKDQIIMHCFSGKKTLVKEILDNGWNVSIPTTVVKLQQFQDMVQLADISHILTETDCPYLSPFSGVKNEPAFVAESIKKIAMLKKMQEEDAANVIFSNYQRIFL